MTDTVVTSGSVDMLGKTARCSSYTEGWQPADVLRKVHATCFKLVSSLAYSLTVKMEAICSSETLVYFHQTTRRCVPKYNVLEKHR
jgi:hypothetical protein